MSRDQLETQNQTSALFESLSYLWRWKYLFLAGMLVFGALGLGYGLLATPVYKADALIAPPEVSGRPGAGALLSQLGGLGGMMASQIGFGNNGLDRMEILLTSRELNEKLIRDHDLLPELFPKLWDRKSKAWKAGVDTSLLLRRGIEIMRTGVLDVSTNPKKNVLTITASFRDSVMAASIVEFYLKTLNERIRSGVIADAEANRKFIEDQLATTLDPLLREKLQQLMSTEIEKSMLVSSKSFDVLEKPTMPLFRSKPNKKAIFIMSLLLGGFFSFMGILVGKGISEAKSRVAAIPARRQVGSAVTMD